MIGTVMIVCPPDARSLSTSASADALGVGVAWPFPPMKYQSPPELDESCCQLYREVASPLDRHLQFGGERLVDLVAVHPVDERRDRMDPGGGVHREGRTDRGGGPDPAHRHHHGGEARRHQGGGHHNAARRAARSRPSPDVPHGVPSSASDPTLSHRTCTLHGTGGTGVPPGPGAPKIPRWRPTSRYSRTGVRTRD